MNAFVLRNNQISVSNSGTPTGTVGLIEVLNAGDSPVPFNERQTFETLIGAYTSQVQSLFCEGGAIVGNEMFAWGKVCERFDKNEIATFESQQICTILPARLQRELRVAVAPNTINQIGLSATGKFYFSLYSIEDRRLLNQIQKDALTRIGEHFLHNIWKHKEKKVSPNAIASACLYDVIQLRNNSHPQERTVIG